MNLKKKADIDGVAVGFWTIVLAMCGAVALASTQGCASVAAGAAAPQSVARKAVVAVAQGVKEGDHLCAQFALQTKSAPTAKVCADAYDLARPTLIAAEATLDAVDQGAAGQLACVALDAVVALDKYAAVLTQAKIALPESVTTALSLTSDFSVLCPVIPVVATDAGAPVVDASIADGASHD